MSFKNNRDQMPPNPVCPSRERVTEKETRESFGLLLLQLIECHSPARKTEELNSSIIFPIHQTLTNGKFSNCLTIRIVLVPL